MLENQITTFVMVESKVSVNQILPEELRTLKSTETYWLLLGYKSKILLCFHLFYLICYLFLYALFRLILPRHITLKLLAKYLKSKVSLHLFIVSFYHTNDRYFLKWKSHSNLLTKFQKSHTICQCFALALRFWNQ